jgi:predicted transcriptional regulator
MGNTASSEKGTEVKGRSESVELREEKKGFFVIDIPEASGDEAGKPDLDSARVGRVLTSSRASEGVNLERLKHVFDLVDEELLSEYEKGLEVGGSSVNFENIDLSGLNNRRSEMAILAFILKICREGAKKTKILYDANLSGRQLKNYMSFLMDAGCVEERPVPKRGSVFHTTAKGRMFLVQWTKLISLLDLHDKKKIKAS